MSQDCVFCRIVSGDEKAYVVLEDEATVAFLDQRPLFAGHCLLVPRPHVPTLVELPAELTAPLFTNARLLAEAVPDAFGCDGTFVAINNRVSQSVAHLHVHVVPRRFKDGLKGFFWPRRPYADEAEAASARKALKKSIERLQT